MSAKIKDNWRAKVPKQSTLSKMGNYKLRKQRENDKLDALRSIFIQSFIYIYIYIYIIKLTIKFYFQMSIKIY